MNSNQHQKQHFVPQSYQLGWCNEGYVRVFTLGHQNPSVHGSLKRPQATGFAKNLYTIPSNLLDPQRIETSFLQKIDGEYKNICNIVRSLNGIQTGQNTKKTLSSRHKAYLIHFIESMIIRNPYDIEHLTSFGTLIIDSIAKELNEYFDRTHQLDDAFGDPTAYAREHILGRLLPDAIKNGTKTMITKNMQIVCLELAYKTVAITSDRPVVPILVNNQRIIYFPAAHDTVILLSPEEDGDLEQLLEHGPLSNGKEVIDRFNELVVEQAIKYVYTHPNKTDNDTLTKINSCQERRQSQAPAINPFFCELKVDQTFVKHSVHSQVAAMREKQIRINRFIRNHKNDLSDTASYIAIRVFF